MQVILPAGIGPGFLYCLLSTAAFLTTTCAFPLSQVLADVRTVRAEMSGDRVRCTTAEMAARLVDVGYSVSQRTSVAGGTGQACFQVNPHLCRAHPLHGSSLTRTETSREDDPSSESYRQVWSCLVKAFKAVSGGTNMFLEERRV